MKVKITSNGYPMGTRIVDEDGKDIEGVRAVSFRADADIDNGFPVVKVELMTVELEYEGHAVMHGPKGRIRKIEYEDGTVDEFAVL